MRASRVALLLLAAALGYLLVAPVPIDPVAWTAPEDPGYAGPFAANQRLATLERIDIGPYTGPEDLALGAKGQLYVSTHEGALVELGPDGTFRRVVTDALGRALGIDVAPNQEIIVADAMRGLLSVTSSGAITVLADACEGIPMVYADDVAASKDGDRIFVSDASTKFAPAKFGGTLPASKLDLLEHRGLGRIIEYRRSTGETRTVLDGLHFANGVALTEDESKLIIAETGEYRVIALHLEGPRAGETDVLLENLPGFPDNIETGRDGRLWIGLVSARNKAIDALAPYPFVRKIVLRLPDAIRPDVVRYGHVFAIDAEGNVQVDLQDPTGAYAKTTGALEVGPYLFVSSLGEPQVGRLQADPTWSER